MATDALVRVVLQGDEAVSGAERVSRALSRLERNEPALAMRQTRVAIDELAVSASGLDPRLARVSATLAQFGIGGTAGLVAVAGFAAITLEVKTLVGQADALDAKLLKLNTTLASGNPTATALLRAQEVAQQREQLPGRGFLNIHRGFFQSLSRDALAAGDEGDAAQRASLRMQELQDINEFNQRHRAILDASMKKEQERARTIAQSVLEVERASVAYTHLLDRTKVTGAQLEAFAQQEDRLRVMTSSLTDAEKKQELGRLAEVRRITTLSADETAFRATGLGQRYLAATGTRPFTTASMAPIFMPLRGGPPNLAAFTPGAVDDRGVPLDPDARRAYLNAHPGAGIQPGSAPSGSSALAILAALSSITSGAAGGAGGLVGGVGSAVTTLSGVKSLGLAGLGPLGAALSVGGGLLSLLGGGGNKVHVTIDSYEKQALDQMKELRADPATRDVILVNATDPRQTLYQSGRLGRRDATSRGP